MALDERNLFNEKSETRTGRYTCPKCRRPGDYSIRWVRRSKKDRLPPGANEEDRAKFAKLRDYLLRLDDEVTCKACGKKFEIPSTSSRAGPPKKSSTARSASRRASRNRFQRPSQPFRRDLHENRPAGSKGPRNRHGRPIDSDSPIPMIGS